MSSEQEFLLRKEGNKSDRFLRQKTRKRKRRNCIVTTLSLVLLGSIVSLMVIYKEKAIDPHRSYAKDGTTWIIGRSRAIRAMIRTETENDGILSYGIDWNGDGIADNDYGSIIDREKTTFADLAKLMLLPWYEASMLAVSEDPIWDELHENGSIEPSQVRGVRRVMLIARDMIDVFSPVFPSDKRKKDRSLWKKLRTLYREGYQKLGEFKDLEGVTYSQNLLDERIKSVTDWRSEFIAFQKFHRIRRYLYSDVTKGGGIDPNGCYYHKSSHLFWDTTQELPCGNDLGLGSLRALAKVQLQHALEYLEESRTFETVIPIENEKTFHNLRKVLRIFLDEYDLFGNILHPGGENWDEIRTTSTDDDEDNESDLEQEYEDPLETALVILNRAQKKLGRINDEWTAYDIYLQKQKHFKKQKAIAKRTDKRWKEFLNWQGPDKHDLEAHIRYVLEQVAS